MRDKMCRESDDNILRNGESHSVSPDTELPEAVPLLNRRDEYRIGGGLVSAGGAGDGTWNCANGPWYTGSSFLSREELWIELDGEVCPLRCEMSRCRLTGVYAGQTTIRGMDVRLVDAAPWDQPWLTRLIVVVNRSAQPCRVRMVAGLGVDPATGVQATVVSDGQGAPTCLSLRQSAGTFCMFGHRSGWVPDWIERTMLVGFRRTEKVLLGQAPETCRIVSEGVEIAAGNQAEFGLVHLAHAAQRPAQVYVDQLRAVDPVADVRETVRTWRNWFAAVKPEYALDRIPAGRARDIVEGGLACLKTNQSSDGGIVANLPVYNLAWTRDAYCGLRGLLATGHTDESRRFLLFMHRKFLAHAFIPNAISCGSDIFALYNGNHENNPGRHQGAASPCPEANTAPETPALLMLAARDYHHATGDGATLAEMDVTLRHCLDIQLKHAVANGYRLESSGDETELCGAVATVTAGYDRILDHHWSMASMALALAAIDFYVDVMRGRGLDPSAYYSAMEARLYDLPAERDRFEEALERDFWRTDDPTAPGGVHTWCRVKDGFRFPPGHITNLTLFPIYHGVRLRHADRLIRDVQAVRDWFDPVRRSVPLVPVVGDGRYLGHDLGYLLWSLVKADDGAREAVHDALVNGPSALCWGAFAEAYDADGTPNGCRLRTFETGVNVDAVAAFHGLGCRKESESECLAQRSALKSAGA